MRIPDSAIGRPETEDRSELPLEERLERAADRFEERIADWEQQRLDENLDERLKEVLRYEGFIQDIVQDRARARVGPVAYAESKLKTTGPHDRRRKIQALHGSPVPKERRPRIYGKAQGQGNNRVLDHHGAARWFERPGNHERLTGVKKSLSDQVVLRAKAA